MLKNELSELSEHEVSWWEYYDNEAIMREVVMREAANCESELV